jgi:hypothetical protein
MQLTIHGLPYRSVNIAKRSAHGLSPGLDYWFGRTGRAETDTRGIIIA